MTAMNDVGLLLLLGAWFIVNLSLMRDWISRRRQQEEESI
jgi:hypothetical protein